MDLPTKKVDTSVTLDDFALIDEISGLTPYLEGFMRTQDIPETVKDRIRARMFTYQSEKPKTVALNEMREVIFGGGR
tara:strand:- start:106 stop:336 length:231 start_codon:yes stop_codon:yes gene_type:complete